MGEVHRTGRDADLPRRHAPGAAFLHRREPTSFTTTSDTSRWRARLLPRDSSWAASLAVPGVKFAFLEGGVGWACSLYSDLIGHWKKRNRSALEEVNPDNLDHKLMRELFERFGSKHLAERLEGSAIFATSGATPQAM